MSKYFDDSCPFGATYHESEIKNLSPTDWERIFVRTTPFISEAERQGRYLVIGRRGSGKTTIAHHIANTSSLGAHQGAMVSKPELYYGHLLDIAKAFETSGLPDAIVIPKLAKIWTTLFWSIAFDRFATKSRAIRVARDLVCPNYTTPYEIAKNVLQAAANKYLGSGTGQPIGQGFEEFWESKKISRAKEEVLKLATTTPLYIAIDSLERYELQNSALMRTVAALIQAAHEFQSDFSGSQIHIKVFIPGEIYCDLRDKVVLNPLKQIQFPVFVRWTPLSLATMICLRFYHYLRSRDLLAPESRAEIDWADSFDVLAKVWNPYFGEKVVNQNGVPENSFLYILRHTQLLPRQLIVMCNNIASLAIAQKSFPRLLAHQIVEGVKMSELHLASEVFNANADLTAPYGIALVTDVLNGCSKTFPPVVLERRMRQDFLADQRDKLPSPPEFRRILAHLGIIGRLRGGNTEETIFEADFEYGMDENLELPNNRMLAIHPLFYEKLNIPKTDRSSDANTAIIVYPFPQDEALNRLIYGQT